MKFFHLELGYFVSYHSIETKWHHQQAKQLRSWDLVVSKVLFVCLCHFVYLFVFRRQFFLLIFLEPEYLAECWQWGCSGCRGGLVFLAVGSEALPGNLGVPGSIWKSLYSWHSSGLIPCPSSSRRHYSIRRWALKLATLDLHLGSTNE